MIKFGSVCSGIEAASVAWNPLGWKAVWLSEIEPFPCEVLAHHYPDVPNLGDMTRLPTAVLTGEVAAPDVLCGGTPCQSFSVAGMREGLNDPRGQLTIKFVELADAIDHVRTRAGKPECITLWENVPGVLSDRGNAFGCFLGALAGEDCELQPPGGRWKDAGCVYGPKRTIAWRVLDAQYFGLAQRRRRVFVVASARNDFDPCAVLFESDSLRRDTAPSREARQVSPTIPARSTAGGGLGTDFDCDGGVITTHTLRGEGFDASEDGAGRGTQLVPVTTPTLTSNGYANRGFRDEHGLVPVAVDGVRYAYYSHDYANDRITDVTGINPALTARNTASGNLNVAVPVGVTVHGTDGCAKIASYDDLAQCLRARTPGNIDNSSTTVVQHPVAIQDVRGTPPVPVAAMAVHGTQDPDTLRDLAHPLGGRNQGQENAVFGIPGNWIGRKPENGGNAVEPMHNIAPCLTGADRHGVAYAFAENTRAGVEICGAFFAGQGAKAGSIAYSTDVAPTLKASDSGTNRTPSVHIDAGALAFQPRHYSGRERMGGEPSEVCHTLSAQAGQGDSSPHVAYTTKLHNTGSNNALPVVAFTTEQTPKFNDDCALTLTKQSPTGGGQIQSVMSAMQVRRMTPLECERLMGFPDGYTAIPWRNKPASECPDGPRYKALGNSWAVPVVAWIGKRIDTAIKSTNHHQNDYDHRNQRHRRAGLWPATNQLA